MPPTPELTEEDIQLKQHQVDHCEYTRIANKSLIFGMEEQMTYTGHKHAHVKNCLANCIANFNVKVYASWDSKTLHLWSMADGSRVA